MSNFYSSSLLLTGEVCMISFQAFSLWTHSVSRWNPVKRFGWPGERWTFKLLQEVIADNPSEDFGHKSVLSCWLSLYGSEVFSFRSAGGNFICLGTSVVSAESFLFAGATMTNSHPRDMLAAQLVGSHASQPSPKKHVEQLTVDLVSACLCSTW